VWGGGVVAWRGLRTDLRIVCSCNMGGGNMHAGKGWGEWGGGGEEKSGGGGEGGAPARVRGVRRAVKGNLPPGAQRS